MTFFYMLNSVQKFNVEKYEDFLSMLHCHSDMDKTVSKYQMLK